jgi:hypothetical protein
VFALGAAFKADVAVADAPLQRLVVAGFEVQAIHPLQRAPVAAVGDRPGGRLPTAVQRDQAAGNRLAVALGDEQQPVLRHVGCHAVEESRGVR